ncbi:MAG: PDZ domain-containing protein [Cryomorphaceae bacterium]|nr:PDZ domain-containing protein [Cryomorphaceae bacterium]
MEDSQQTPAEKKSPFQPLFYAIVLLIGVYIGSLFAGDTILIHRSSDEDNPNKLVNIINKIDEMYVDSIEKSALIDKAINAILEDLDPHSYYISAAELAAVTEPLEGNFEGIGVEFMIQKDTLMVVSPIEGGPSETAGILPGDRIITVEGENIAGLGLTNEKVMTLLKGEKGTIVNLGIKRNDEPELLSFSIERDKIPIYSVVASVMIEPEIGYLKLTRFAKNSYEEFMAGMKELADDGAKSVILDLRGNGGGYLNSAIPMVQEFLDNDQLIVYTEGKNSPRRDYYSKIKGVYNNMDVVVLINQGSASASEILAGALQDHDRSITVGRRSFGKGLVQDEIGLPDHSALRLTVARYYTPTGRSIQRPYGEGVDYDNDLTNRFETGELLNLDSLQFQDSLRYVTKGGRFVYGGGGIMPDVFVPIDTLGGSFYLSDLSYSGVMRTFAFDFVNKNRDLFAGYANVSELLEGYSVPDELLEKLFNAAEKEGIYKDKVGIKNSREVIRTRILAFIAKNVFNEEAYYRVLLEDDLVFDHALDVARDYDAYKVVDGKLTLPQSE